MYYILAINPGSTSTKLAVYGDKEVILEANLDMAVEETGKYENITDQFNARLAQMYDALAERKFDLRTLNGVVGRGGMLPPVRTGGYLVNDTMKNRILSGTLPEHASNLGALLADAVAAPLGIPAYIYDAVSADELYDVARITGIPEYNRTSFCHVLNSRAMARKVAEKYGKRYEDMRFVVAHLGGGISISAHEGGKIVDSIADDSGPFSPERSGSIPLLYIVDMCTSFEYSKKEILKKLRGNGGIKAHLGTYDCREVERRICEGDQKARLVYEAQAYQIAKGIGELAPVLNGHIDYVILTGGLAYSEMLTGWIRERVEFIAPVEICPGENELESLAYGALRILKGEEQVRDYTENND